MGDDHATPARLIAALLAALRAVHEAGRMSDQNLALHCAEIARRAIAKVEGGEV